jgi:hypothetical protein
MGIGMLASPVVRMKVRDNWIGWTVDAVIDAVRSGTLDQTMLAQALYARLDAAAGEVRSDDLVSAEQLALPTESALLKLEQRASGAAAARKRRLSSAYERMMEEDGGVIRSESDDAKHDIAEADLVRLSEDPLFVQKRADTLMRVLAAKLAFIESGALRADQPVRRLLAHPKGERALATALQEARKAGLSSQVADLSVCGAVAPYNALLGGKLVALLMASGEALDAYRERYASQPSIISSQMAGRLVYRPAQLQVLTTTSLYGNASSQYNRLRLTKGQVPELAYDLVWHQLAKTKGYGTYHLAPSTLRLLREVSEQHHGARRINNRFGEGASPRMRQTREGLDVLGIDASQVMDHATPRLFFACELHPGGRAALLGLPSQAASPQQVSAAVISDGWLRRWVRDRITRPGVLEAMAPVGPDMFAAQLKPNTPNVEAELAACG